MTQIIVQRAGHWLAQFNLPLIFLALLVCCAGSYIITVLGAHGLATRRNRRWLWLLFLVPNFAATVWVTHFIAMLAFMPGPQLYCALGRTLLSVVVAMAAGAPPLALMLLYPSSRFIVVSAGTGLGLAIGAMHFTGMSALRFCGVAGFGGFTGPLALALGVGFSILMVRLLIHPAGKPRLLRAMLALMAAICSLHFTALLGGGIVIIKGAPGPQITAGLIKGGSPTLAIIVAFVSGVLFFSAFIAAITDRRLALMNQARHQAETLNYFATHDELTRLANRRQLHACLTQLLSQPGQHFALHYLDIDRFKPINSLFGHAVGDKLLLQAAARLQALLGPGDMLARLGGDEFALLQPLPGEGEDVALAERMVKAMAEPFQLAEGMMRAGASIGLVTWGGTPEEAPETLLGQADMAMSLAKHQGGGQVCLYTPELSAHIASRRQLARDLGAAIGGGEMFLHFQPLCTANGTPRGFEALLRWKHHERGMISPAEFIPFSEQSGQIHAIGMFVLEQACRAAVVWPGELRVAVNISAVQLGDEGLFAAIKDILSRTGLPPRRLELEITESALIEDAGRVNRMLRDMNGFGLQIAIDDFGTGYSNLGHLRDFRAGRLKIDRSFISGLRGDSDAASIVRAIAGLGHALNMKVLAEGVETESELRLVRAMGCDEVQGYYLARPMPEAEILPWLTQARLSPRALVFTE